MHPRVPGGNGALDTRSAQSGCGGGPLTLGSRGLQLAPSPLEGWGFGSSQPPSRPLMWGWAPTPRLGHVSAGGCVGSSLSWFEPESWSAPACRPTSGPVTSPGRRNGGSLPVQACPGMAGWGPTSGFALGCKRTWWSLSFLSRFPGSGGLIPAWAGGGVGWRG